MSHAYDDVDRAEAAREARAQVFTRRELESKARELGEQIQEIGAAIATGDYGPEIVDDLTVLVGDARKLCHDLNFVREAMKNEDPWP